MIRAVVYELDAFEKMQLSGTDIFYSWQVSYGTAGGLPEVVLTFSLYGLCADAGRLLLYESAQVLKGARYTGADLLAAMNKDAWGRVEDFRIKVKELAARRGCACFWGRLEEGAVSRCEKVDQSGRAGSLIVGS